jgi:hypothetical protein
MLSLRQLVVNRLTLFLLAPVGYGICAGEVPQRVDKALADHYPKVGSFIINP